MHDTAEPALTEGKVVAVRGSVVDARFDAELPPIHTILRARRNHGISIEVVTQLDKASIPWPEAPVPEMIGCAETSQAALVSEYLFVSLYQVCAASCAAENAARLARDAARRKEHR